MRLSSTNTHVSFFRTCIFVYKSLLVVSVPHGSLVKFVSPALFSHVCLPLRGPGAGTFAPATAVALSLRALRRLTMASGVKSS